MGSHAESVLQSDMNNGPALNPKWVCDSPVLSDIEAKLRRLLVEWLDADKILGIQVCAYKDGEVIIDTAAGVLGRDDPRPVQHDTLFPVFSVTKPITAGLVHWLVDNGKLKLDEYVANIWPEFRSNGKDQIKVHHVLNHTAGLYYTLASLLREDSLLFSDWEECLHRIAMSTPDTEPGHQQIYHFLSFGWLCGGIIEHASGKKFLDILEEAIVRPLNIEGEMYIGIPPGVESRLATLTVDGEEDTRNRGDIPSKWEIAALFNSLNIRRAIIPSSGANVSARALARYYAALADGGVVPPPHPSSSRPPQKLYDVPEKANKIFSNLKIRDAFLGAGDYENMILPNGKFGLGCRRLKSKDGSVIAFGQAGMGGSTGHCDINNRFAIAVTVNKMSCEAITEKIIEFVCSELGIDMPEPYNN